MTLSLDKGDLIWYSLKCLTKEYHIAHFHDCSNDNVGENAMVTDLPIFAGTRMTLYEGHINWKAMTVQLSLL